MSLKRIFRKLKRFIMKGTMILGIYLIGLVALLMMSERIERLNDLEKQDNVVQVAFDK